jgi:hypothetical protein
MQVSRLVVESYGYKIEMNECGESEFRCRNGLCIPEEYWLDGKLCIFQ